MPVVERQSCRNYNVGFCFSGFLAFAEPACVQEDQNHFSSVASIFRSDAFVATHTVVVHVRGFTASGGSRVIVVQVIANVQVGAVCMRVCFQDSTAPDIAYYMFFL